MDGSAVRDVGRWRRRNKYYCRKVLAINFPALCYVFGGTFTAYQLEQAWCKMPLVKIGKTARGRREVKGERAVFGIGNQVKAALAVAVAVCTSTVNTAVATGTMEKRGE